MFSNGAVAKFTFVPSENILVFPHLGALGASTTIVSSPHPN
jgi:hypothetical protein